VFTHGVVGGVLHPARVVWVKGAKKDEHARRYVEEEEEKDREEGQALFALVYA